MMEEHTFIECAKEADREMLAMILTRNGYTVKRTKKKVGNKFVTFIEFWRE